MLCHFSVISCPVPFLNAAKIISAYHLTRITSTSSDVLTVRDVYKRSRPTGYTLKAGVSTSVNAQLDEKNDMLCAYERTKLIICDGSDGILRGIMESG